MSYTCFDVEISDQVAHVRMIRPEKRNSMNPAFWEELPTIIKDIDHNVRARGHRHLVHRTALLFRPRHLLVHIGRNTAQTRPGDNPA